MKSICTCTTGAARQLLPLKSTMSKKIIKEKFISASSRTEIGIDPLAAFTSGRSTFWTYDILTMIKNNPIRILFGNNQSFYSCFNELLLVYFLLHIIDDLLSVYQ